MPLTYSTRITAVFEAGVSRAGQAGIGILGMKSMADGICSSRNTVTAVECLHYALNLPTSVVITGIDS